MGSDIVNRESIRIGLTDEFVELRAGFYLIFIIRDGTRGCGARGVVDAAGLKG